LWRDQLYPVAHSDKNPSPMMSPSTGFQSDLGRWHLGKEGFNLPPPELTAEDNVVLLVQDVQRENLLRRIDQFAFIFRGIALSLRSIERPHLGASNTVGCSTQQFSMKIQG
jgi:hypothetical protein